MPPKPPRPSTRNYPSEGWKVPHLIHNCLLDGSPWMSQRNFSFSAFNILAVIMKLIKKLPLFTIYYVRLS